MSRPFIWVKSLETGHQFDVHESAYDPERHARIERVEPAARPRRPKVNVKPRRAKKTSASEAGTGASPADTSATPVETAGTEEVEQANG